MKNDLIADLENFYNKYYFDKLNYLAYKWPEEKSLNVNFEDIEEYDPRLADLFLNEPDKFLEYSKKAIEDIGIVLDIDKNTKLVPNIRVFNLPKEKMKLVRNLKSEEINKVVVLDGLITQITTIIPHLKTACYRCNHCGEVYYVDVNNQKDVQLGECVCGRKSYSLDLDRCKFIDFQKAQLREPLEKIKGATQAQAIDLYIYDDLTNKVLPGEKVIVVGILRLKKPKNQKKGFFDKYIEVIHIQKLDKEFEELEITKEDLKRIKELSQDPNIFEKIRDSIAPAVYGHEKIKEAIALQLFGGTPGKVLPDGTEMRSNFHILLIGDPGAAKSRLLKYVKNLAPKSIYVSGKSATGGGLTAIAEKDEFAEGGWTIKAGALVLASGGIACLHPNSRILYNDKYIEIKKLFNKRKMFKATMKNGEEIEICEITGKVNSLNTKNMKMVVSDTTYIRRKFYDGSLIKLKLKSGNEILVTPDHLLLDGKSLEWKKCVNFKVGDFVVCPLKIKKCNMNNKIKNSINFENMFQLDDNLLLSFIAGFMDSNCCIGIDNKKDVTCIEFLFGNNKRKVLSFSLLLRRFGIYSKVKKKQKNIYSIIITDKYDIIKLLNLTKKYSIKAKEILKDLPKQLYLSKQERRQILKRVENNVNVLVYYKASKKDKVKDYFLDEIVNIEKIKYSGYVYDLYVPEYHNFVCEGIIVHNCIDEFDKMSDSDKSALHEAMESGTLSVAKAGIVTTFRADASILAAANPKFGRFDKTIPPSEQFNIPSTILSRFDLIFPIYDNPSKENDLKVAEHILNAHMIAAHSEDVSDAEKDKISPKIEIELLRKYIAYARKNVKPKLTKEAKEKIIQYYLKMREMSKKTGTVPITARYLEGLIRLAEASAKLHLDEYVRERDAQKAIELVEYFLRNIGQDPETGNIDIDIITTGRPTSKTEKIKTIINTIRRLDKEIDEITLDVLCEELKGKIEKNEIEEILENLIRSGDIYCPKHGIYKPT